MCTLSMILYSRKALQSQPGGSIIFDVKCSLALPEDIEKHGGKPVMWRTGYTNIFANRLETGAPFAGEFSGHMRYVQDQSPDTEVKAKIYDRYIKPYFDVLFTIDDRPKVVEMWRQKGLVCFAVEAAE